MPKMNNFFFFTLLEPVLSYLYLNHCIYFYQKISFLPKYLHFSFSAECQHFCHLCPAGKAAAVRCPSWWWATRGTCSGSASCPAGPCRCWSRRRGSAATWNARPSSTGTWCCSSRSCWALPWRGACGRTTPPSGCRGRYRGTAAASCDREGFRLRGLKDKRKLLSKWLEISLPWPPALLS